MAMYNKGSENYYLSEAYFSTLTDEWKEKVVAAIRSGTPIVRDPMQATELTRQVALKKDVHAFHFVASPDITEYAPTSISKLTLTGASCAHSVVQQPVNRETPYVWPTVGDKLLSTGFGEIERVVLYENYTPAFINLRVEVAQGDDKAVALALLKDGHIYRALGKGYKELWCVKHPVQEKEKEFLLELASGEDVPRDVVFNGKNVKEGVLVYGDKEVGLMTSTNGQVKEGEITLPCNNLAGFDYEAIADKVTFGLWSEIKSMGLEATKAKEVAQLSTRVAQHKAPAVEGIYLGSYAIIMGITDDTRDGLVDLYDEYVAKWLNERCDNRYLVLPTAVRGKAIQCRPFLTKGAGCVRSRAYMEHLLSFWGEKLGYRVETIYQDEVTPEKQMEFNRTVHSKGREGGYKGCIVIVRPSKKWNDQPLHMIADLNGLKTFYKLDRRSGLNVLSTSEVVKNAVGNTKTSTQTIMKLLVADYGEAMDLYEDRFDEELKETRESILGEKGMAPRFGDFGDHTNYTQMLSSVAPAFSWKHYRPSYVSGTRKRISEGLVNKCARLNFRSDGFSGIVQPDYGVDFGMALLRHYGDIVEVFCPFLNRKGVEEALGWRFPTAHPKSKGRIVPISVETILDRALEQGATAEQLLIIEDAFRSCDDSVIIVPALKSVMDMLDGMDFDGDHLVFELDKNKIAISRKEGSLVVHIMENAEFLFSLWERQGKEAVDTLLDELYGMTTEGTADRKEIEAAETTYLEMVKKATEAA